MKPDDRALDIAVVGLGQAGGNIASEFHRRGIRALALNTATTDLGALDPGGLYPSLPSDRRLYIGLDGYDGAGADATFGAECIAAHEDLIRSTVMEDARDADALIVAAGLGGGTGSAVNQLIDILRTSEVPLIGLFTLPTEAESALAKVNTVRAINDLVDAPLSAWIFIDNARVATAYRDMPVAEYYPHINQTLAAPIDDLSRLNKRDDLSVIRAFDGEDFRKLLLAGGVLTYGVIELPNITVDEVTGAFFDSLEASDLMPAGFEIATVSHAGLVIEAPASVLAKTPIATFEAIDERLKNDSGGAALYRGVYQTSSDTTTLRFIASTRSLPHRIRELLASAREEGILLQEKLQEQLPTLELGDIDELELFRPEARNRASERPRRVTRKPAPAEPLEGMELDRVRGAAPTAPRRRPTRAKRKGSRTGKAARKSPEPEEDPFKNITSSRIMEESLPADAETSEIDLKETFTNKAKPSKGSRKQPAPKPAPPAMEPGEEPPRPEVYDKLVSDYLHADGDDARSDIVKRLENDSLSAQTAVRYYAVDAMSKLGKETFGRALLVAAEDGNDAVRTLATQALQGS